MWVFSVVRVKPKKVIVKKDWKYVSEFMGNEAKQDGRLEDEAVIIRQLSGSFLSYADSNSNSNARNDEPDHSETSDDSLTPSSEGISEDILEANFQTPIESDSEETEAVYRCPSCPWWCRIILWIVVLLLCVLFTVYCLLQIGKQTTSLAIFWCVTVLISLMISLLIEEPIKCLIMAIFFASLRKPVNHKVQKQDELTAEIVSGTFIS